MIFKMTMTVHDNEYDIYFYKFKNIINHLRKLDYIIQNLIKWKKKEKTEKFELAILIVSISNLIGCWLYDLINE